MRVQRSNAAHFTHTCVTCRVRNLNIQFVERFHMVRNKCQRHDDELFHASLSEFADAMKRGGFQCWGKRTHTKAKVSRNSFS